MSSVYEFTSNQVSDVLGRKINQAGKLMVMEWGGAPGMEWNRGRGQGQVRRWVRNACSGPWWGVAVGWGSWKGGMDVGAWGGPCGGHYIWNLVLFHSSIRRDLWG